MFFIIIIIIVIVIIIIIAIVDYYVIWEKLYHILRYSWNEIQSSNT